VPCPGTSVEFKFLALHSDGDLMRWEPLFCNRRWPVEAAASRMCIRATFGKVDMELLEGADVEEVVEPAGCGWQCSWLDCWLAGALAGRTAMPLLDPTGVSASLLSPPASRTPEGAPGAALTTPPVAAAPELRQASAGPQNTPLRAGPCSSPALASPVTPAQRRVQDSASAVKIPAVGGSKVPQKDIETAVIATKALAPRSPVEQHVQGASKEACAVPAAQAVPVEPAEAVCPAAPVQAPRPQPVAPPALAGLAEPGQPATRQWSQLPSVGTWLQAPPCRGPGRAQHNECSELAKEEPQPAGLHSSPPLGKTDSHPVGMDNQHDTLPADCAERFPCARQCHCDADLNVQSLPLEDHVRVGPCYVGVRLRVSCEVQVGLSVCVTGSDPTLGNWDLARAKLLCTSEPHFPCWASDVLLFEAPPQGSRLREVQYKFAVLSPGAATAEVAEEDVDFEAFNRTLLIPGGAEGALLEPAEPLVFGAAEAWQPEVGPHESGSPTGGAGSTARDASQASKEGCRRGDPPETDQGRASLHGPSMMLEACSRCEAQGNTGIYHAPPCVQSGIPDQRPASPEGSSSEPRPGQDVGAGNALSNGEAGTAEASQGAATRGTESKPRLCRPCARFCIVRFRASCDTGPGERLFVVGDDVALGNWDPRQGLPLHTSAQYFPRWVSKEVLLELPMAGLQARTVQYKLAIVRCAARGGEWSEDECVRFEELGRNRSLLVRQGAVGRLLEPAPAEFGVGDSDGGRSLGPQEADTVPGLQWPHAEAGPAAWSALDGELAAELEDTGGRKRQRSVAAGESMLDLVAVGARSKLEPAVTPKEGLARQRLAAAGESMLDLVAAGASPKADSLAKQSSGLSRRRLGAAGESMLDLASAAKRAPVHCAD